jgi:excisionase family DNA binding protein
MTKISIVSRRRRDTRFPETKAPQRAPARELGEADEAQTLPMDELEVLAGALSLEFPELPVDDLAGLTIDTETSGAEEALNAHEGAAQESSDMTLRLPLNPEQSQLLDALPYLAKTRQQNEPTLTFDLTESRDHNGIILQFSLHNEAVPEMLSLKELCQQLKVGRRFVLRLIRQGRLRCYRIGKRYRFAISDVKQYLAQSSSQ